MTDTQHTDNLTRYSTAALAARLAVDVALVVLFAVWGNRSHDSGLSVADIWSTSWPFLAGLALGWVISRFHRSPDGLWPSGITVVLTTVIIGMTLRHFLTEGGVQLSFVIVATTTLTVFLLGRRLLTRLLTRRS